MTRNPVNAKRVRSFHLDPAALRDLSRAEAIVNEHHRPPQQRGALATFTAQLFQSLPGLSASKSPQAGGPISAAKITEDLETVLPSLRNVDNFSFTWEMVSAFTEPYLPLAWRSLGTNLQYLRLNLHPRSVSSQLPHDINFPCLRSLHFSFTIADDPRDLLLPVGEPISRFINKFEYTLERLYIGSPQRRDLRNMYASLTRFKKLQSFEISPHTFASPESLITFLSNHSDTLTFLTYVSDSNPLFVNGLSNLELHHLEKLVMRLHYVPYPKAWWNVPSPFFNSISSTLRILTIEGAVTIAELDQVLNALVGDNPKDAALEEFSVAVSSLSVEVLALLAKRVPNLKSLDLRIHDVVAKGGFPITPSEFFPFTSVSLLPILHRFAASRFTVALNTVTSPPTPNHPWRFHTIRTGGSSPTPMDPRRHHHQAPFVLRRPRTVGAHEVSRSMHTHNQELRQERYTGDPGPTQREARGQNMPLGSSLPVLGRSSGAS
jgi:hypothetical protein